MSFKAVVFAEAKAFSITSTLGSMVSICCSILRTESHNPVLFAKTVVSMVIILFSNPTSGSMIFFFKKSIPSFMFFCKFSRNDNAVGDSERSAEGEVVVLEAIVCFSGVDGSKPVWVPLFNGGAGTTNLKFFLGIAEGCEVTLFGKSEARTTTTFVD